MRQTFLSMSLVTALLIAAVVALNCSSAWAQQATGGYPVHSVGDSFFEQTGVSWGGNFGGVNFSFGGGANPGFGGHRPGAGLDGGFGFGGRGGLNFGLSQGSSRSMVSQTPTVTGMNGQPAFFHDTSLTPFVIGHVPVVGGFPVVGYMNPIRPLPAHDGGTPMASVSPLNHRIEAMRHAAAQGNRPMPKRKQKAPAAAPKLSAGPSSATRAAPSVAEARRLRAKEQSLGDGEAMLWFERGKTAEADGKPKTANIFYQMAARRASGELRERIQSRLAAVSQ